jgi:excisionase family DNA binding protein
MQGKEDVTEEMVATATLTRDKVASILGVSVSTIRRMEGKSLHPRLVGRTWLFDLAEVMAAQRSARSTTAKTSSSGELAAELFRRFNEGQPLRRVVRECRQDPEVVQALYRQWATSLGETPAAERDLYVLARQDEQDLVCWEERMRAMMAADEEQDREDRLAREARRERRVDAGSGIRRRP